MENGDAPAFPEVVTDRDCYPPDIYSTGGMTKREYMASQAMMAVVGRQELLEPSLAAEFVVKYADALLRRLNAKPGE